MTAARRILVLDDHAVVREGLAQLLAPLGGGCEVLQAAGLAQAQALMAQLQGPPLDLVVLDLHLGPAGGGADPLAALRWWRSQHPQLPVVMLSGDDDPELATAAFGLGLAGWLSKSADTLALLGGLSLVLQGGRIVPPFVASRRAAEPGSGAELTERQRDVLRCLSQGLSNKEIARELALAEPTVKQHLVVIFRVLGVRNRAQAALAARQQRLG